MKIVAMEDRQAGKGRAARSAFIDAGRWKLVALTIVWIAVAAVAADGPSRVKNMASAGPKTGIDPFTLKPVALSPAAASPVEQTLERDRSRAAWQSIRIPARPAPRSAFRPCW
jgi:hypothetical protein